VFELENEFEIEFEIGFEIKVCRKIDCLD